MDDLDGDLVVRNESPAARKGVPPEERRCKDSEKLLHMVSVLFLEKHL